MAKTATLDRHIFWQPWSEPGLEHLHLVQYDWGVRADGLVIGMRDGSPFRLHYEIQCDLRWRVRSAEVLLLGEPERRIVLHAGEDGRWTNAEGQAIPVLDSCSEVDIAATPFTNTLPIRRLAWQPGASADLLVAYISVPEMRVEPVRQRYTCLALTADDGLFRYEDQGLFAGFTADLTVDADGLVLDYPGLFHRSWAR